MFIINKKVENANNYLLTFDTILSNMAYKMLFTKSTNNITIDFINCMIPHHEAAIFMSNNLLKYTNYEPLIKVAKNIILVQTNGIFEMQEILKTTNGYDNLPNEVNLYMKKYRKIVYKMISKMESSLRDINVNLDFINEMIPHHEGAVLMCNNVLSYKIDPRLKNLAVSIIKEQSKGIIELKKIREQLLKNISSL